MKIKEMEERSGMTRANIRFYESMELLNPTRDANGYRDYSEEDLEILRKIKLLRLLDMPLDEIKALHNGERNLLSVLEQHIHILENKKMDLEKSKNVCVYMRNDHVTYQTLNATYYLNKFSEPEIERAKPLSEDTLPIVYAPWRRYFARSFDLALYATIWFVFAELILNINMLSNFTGKAFFSGLVEILLLLFLEPLFLSRFGTTPGKWLLGLSLTTQSDRRLTYSEAFTRTWRVLIYGMGVNIPLVSLYRLLRSYQLCTAKRTLVWEESYIFVQKKDKFWKILLYPVFRVIFIGCMFLAISIRPTPLHIGELTAMEFCDNFNYLAKQYDDIFNGYLLQEDGTWKKPEYALEYTTTFGNERPNFIFEEENGILKSVSISVEHIPDTTDSEFDFFPTYETAISIAMQAFVKAQEESPMFRNKLDDLLSELSINNTNGWEDFSTTIYGVSLEFDITKNGYLYGSGMYIATDNVKEPLSIEFSITKIKSEN